MALVDWLRVLCVYAPEYKRPTSDKAQFDARGEARCFEEDEKAGSR